MSTGRQLRVLLGVLVATQVITALAGIGLLGRMSPAIGEMLEQNVASVEAVEEMLHVLAGGSPSEVERDAFLAALSAAERNVTERDERAALREIRANARAALEGEEVARRSALRALVKLSEINRDAMKRSDADVQRLAAAGRWALAFLALFGLGATVVSARRARSRLLTPLHEVQAVVTAYRAGDTHRRCAVVGDAELADLARTLNVLLDRSERVARSERPASEARDRILLNEVLDRLEAPTLVVDADGTVVVASRAALDVLARTGGDPLASLDEPERPAVIADVVPLARAALRLVELRP